MSDPNFRPELEEDACIDFIVVLVRNGAVGLLAVAVCALAYVLW